MRYCPSCLVGLDPKAERCPLCGAVSVDTLPIDEEGGKPSPPEGSATPFASKVHNADEKVKLTPREKRKILVELFSVSFGMILIVTLVFDVLFTRSLSWSRYTSVSLAYLWLCAAMPLILWKHPWLLYAVLGPATLVEVFLLFLFAGSLSPFLYLGLPITVQVEGAIVVSGTLISVQKNKGLNVVGIILAALSLLCLGIDLFVSLYNTGSVSWTWSLVVACSALPVAGLFFYLHYRIINRASLRKLFRL